MSDVSVAFDIAAAAFKIGVGIYEAVRESGAKSQAEALAAAKAHLDAIPIRTGPDGAWTKDLERRKAGVLTDDDGDGA